MDSAFAVIILLLILVGPVVAALSGWARGGEMLVRVLVGAMACVLAGLLAPTFTDSPPIPNLFWVLGLAAGVAILTIRKPGALGFTLGGFGMVWLACVFAYPGFLSLGPGIAQKYPGWRSAFKSKERNVLSMAQALLEDTGSSESVPPGWIDKSFPVKDVAEYASKNPAVLRAIERRFHPLWHTWMTGLWRVEEVSWEPWCPGGSASEATKNIEMRPREFR